MSKRITRIPSKTISGAYKRTKNSTKFGKMPADFTNIKSSNEKIIIILEKIDSNLAAFILEQRQRDIYYFKQRIID